MKISLDQKKIIEEYWHFGCIGNELKIEGDYLLFKILDREVVLYHDGIKVIAFDNRCPHRGTRFFEEVCGSEKAICMYHGWSYSRGVITIPDQDQVIENGCIPKLNEYQIEHCGDFIFFTISSQTSLVEQLGEELFLILESLSFDLNVRRDFNSYVYKCYWPIAVENALEPQHLPFIHPSTLNKLDLKNPTNKYWGKNSAVYFEIGNERTKKSLKTLEKILELGNDFYSGYMSIFLYPFVFISSTGGTTYSIQNFYPKDDNSSLFISRLYSVHTKKIKDSMINEAIVEAAIKINKKIFEEDHEICQRISHQSWNDSFGNKLYNSEEKILHFRKEIDKNYE
jgi:phenylpropionate dioxygenase-like ring-hydroxylating dioxygenase large terminal subunit